MPPQQQQHLHSPTETAARLTFRRAPSFSSPVGLPSSTGRGGDGSVFSSISPMATLRGLLSGSTAAASAAAGATVSSSMTARRTQRSMHVGIADEESEDDGSSQGGNGEGSIIPVQMTLGRFNGGGGGGGRTRMVFTDQGWQVGASTDVVPSFAVRGNGSPPKHTKTIPQTTTFGGPTSTASTS